MFDLTLPSSTLAKLYRPICPTVWLLQKFDPILRFVSIRFSPWLNTRRRERFCIPCRMHVAFHDCVRVRLVDCATAQRLVSSSRAIGMASATCISACNPTQVKGCAQSTVKALVFACVFRPLCEDATYDRLDFSVFRSSQTIPPDLSYCLSFSDFRISPSFCSYSTSRLANARTENALPQKRVRFGSTLPMCNLCLA